MRLKIGDHHRHVGKACPQDIALAGFDLHADAEGHVAVDLLNRRPARHVIDLGIRRLGRDNKFAARPVAKRKIPEITFKDQTPVIAPAADDAALDPGAGLGIDHVRHITPDRTCIGAVHIRRQVNFTRPVAGKTVMTAG